MPLGPVARVVQPGAEQRRRKRHERLAAQGNGDAVKTLLPKCAELALALVCRLLGLARMPVLNPQDPNGGCMLLNIWR